jgi:response regulator RpfG family c-di-GMP phosphodiesterase
MNPRVLFVDDETNILSAFNRQVRGIYEISVASSGVQALELISKNAPFEVIVSDFKMPGMNGAEFLEKAREIAPNSTRIMLSGQAEIQGILDVINKGNIFRFLTKPCPPDLLMKNIQDGIDQFRLIRAEKDVLEKTLSASIKMLVDILSMTNPIAFGKALRIRNLVKKFTQTMESENSWVYEVAALLSQIGCISINDSILKNAYSGQSLTADELHLFLKHPQAGSDMIKGIPRLEQVAEIILYQNKNFNGSGFPENSIIGEKIPLGSRILKIASDYDTVLQTGRDQQGVIQIILARAGSGWYDPAVAENFCKVVVETKKYKRKLVTIEQLEEGMILAEDIISSKSSIVAGHKGQMVTNPFRITLLNFKRGGNIGETVHVVIPIEEE